MLYAAKSSSETPYSYPESSDEHELSIEEKRKMLQETWLTADEVSEYLHIARSTVYRLVDKGKIPSVHVGRHVRFSKEAIDKLMASDSLGL